MLVYLLLVVALADPPTVVEVPRTPPAKWTEVKATPGRMLRLTASEKPATWVLVDDADADLDAPASAKQVTFVSAKQGRYRLVAFVADAEPLRVTIVVGDPPAPLPPTPPTPVDPLRARLKAAFDVDAGDVTTKDTARRDLIALYQQAAKLALDPSVTTTGELAARIRAAGQILAPGQLDALRKAAGAEVATVFPADVPLSDTLRQQAAALFTSIAAAMAW